MVVAACCGLLTRQKTGKKRSDSIRHSAPDSVRSSTLIMTNGEGEVRETDPNPFEKRGLPGFRIPFGLLEELGSPSLSCFRGPELASHWATLAFTTLDWR